MSVWPQGDHALLIQNDRPVLAQTTTETAALLDVVHTPLDTAAEVDCS